MACEELHLCQTVTCCKCVVEMAERSWAQWRWGKRWWSTTLAQWLTPLLLFLLSVRSHFLQHVKLFWSFHARFPRLVVHLCERELNQCAVQWKAPQDDSLGSPHYSVQSTKKAPYGLAWFTYKKKQCCLWNITTKMLLRKVKTLPIWLMSSSGFLKHTNTSTSTQSPSGCHIL